MLYKHILLPLFFADVCCNYKLYSKCFKLLGVKYFVNLKHLKPKFIYSPLSVTNL